MRFRFLRTAIAAFATLRTDEPWEPEDPVSSLWNRATTLVGRAVESQGATTWTGNRDVAMHSPGEKARLYIADPDDRRPPLELSFQDVEIPPVADVERWAAQLEAVPRDGRHDVSEVVDYAVRFAALAFRRSSAVSTTIHGLVESPASKGPDVVMIHLQANPNGNAMLAGAHAVLFLYRLRAGDIGAVVSFKGSESQMDWKQAFKFTDPFDGSSMMDRRFIDADTKVHPGFLEYYKTLEALMDKIMVDEVPLLQDVAVPQTSLRQWLYSGQWKWCVFTGYSLGAAMAQLGALFTSQTDAGRTSGGGRRPFLVTTALPVVGNHAFVQAVNRDVRPWGGVRIENDGDLVTRTGYGLFGGQVPGVRVGLRWGLRWANFAEAHTLFSFPSTCGGRLRKDNPKRRIVHFNAASEVSAPMLRHANYYRLRNLNKTFD